VLQFLLTLLFPLTLLFLLTLLFPLTQFQFPLTLLQFPLHHGLPTGTAVPIVTAPQGAGSSTPTLTDVDLPTWKHAAAPSSSSAVSISGVHRDPVRFIVCSRRWSRPTAAA